MVDQLQSNVVIFLQTLNKAVVDLAAQTGILLKDIGGTDHKKKQKSKDDNWEERSKSVDVTEKEKKKYAEIFKNLNLTENVTKLSKSFDKFDKSVSTFLKTSSEQLKTSRQINAELKESLKNLQSSTKAETSTVKQPAIEQPVAESPVVKQPAIEQPVAESPVVKQPAIVQPVAEKQQTPINDKNPTLENLSKNVGIIANILEKQYIAEQKKLDVLSRDQQPVKTVTEITSKTAPILPKEEKSKESSGGFLSMLGNIIKTVIIGAIGLWILKNPEKAMQILKDAWDFMKKVGGMIWEGIKFLWPYVEKFIKIVGGVVDFLGPKVSGAILVLLGAFKLFGGSITGLVWKLTKLLGKGVWGGAKLLGRGVKSVFPKKLGKTAGKAAGKTAGKVAAKTAGKAAGKTAGKVAAKTAGKSIGKSLIKKIPGVGLIAGLGFGLSRLMSGDVTGALGEVTSGAASLVPGVGTAVSAAIDAGLAAKDINQETKKAAKEASEAAKEASEAASDAANNTNELKNTKKDTSLPNIDNNFTSTYKEMTDKLLGVNKEHLHISQLQLNELTSNGMKLDRIIEGFKNLPLNNISINNQSQNTPTTSRMIPKVSSSKISALRIIDGIVNPGGIA